MKSARKWVKQQYNTPGALNTVEYVKAIQADAMETLANLIRVLDSNMEVYLDIEPNGEELAYAIGQGRRALKASATA